MNLDSRVSLLNLSKQLPFKIDDDMKKSLCFAETLIISCSHYDNPCDDELSESDESCEETIELEHPTPPKEEPIEIKDNISEEKAPKHDSEEEDDFHFYFFPDCSKPPPPQDSKASIVIVDGLPNINPASKANQFCLCSVNKKGECECHIKLPCYCGAKTKATCTCGQSETICICDETKPPAPVCTCKANKVCRCHPDGKARPICECDKIDKPCVCYPDRPPCPECICKGKPMLMKSKDTIPKTITSESSKYGEGEVEGEVEGESSYESSCEGTKKSLSTDWKLVEDETVPCECQKPKPKPKEFCECLKDRDCLCVGDTICVCGLRDTCVCESDSDREGTCKTQESRTICSCPKEPTCTCGAQSPEKCKCMPQPQLCVCGDPYDCKCHVPCDCTPPCICGTKVTQDCTCPSQRIPDLPICTCKNKYDEITPKLKKVKAGREGYRWCHEIDPKHTYFDWAYGRHDKIDVKEQEKQKFKILGLHSERNEEEVCPVHGFKAPPYEKKPRKPSLDCCSAVGGISISVETLGEDKDKFLIQVVSNSSKEGAKTGSKLVSIVDCNLHTLEESRIEHITNKKTTKERRSYMAICENGYYNKVTRVCGDRNVVKRLYHSFEDSHELLLEGGNLVFLRYLGITRFKGSIKTDTILIDGIKCESIYVSNGMSQGIVNGKPLYVVRVERHIIEPSGALHQTLSVMTLRGYLVSHEWADNSYIIHLNPLLNVISTKDEIEPHAPLRERWREDLQLLSDYLDFKSTRTSEGGRYIRETSELTNTIRDYLQALLLLRPGDAVHFTRHYFGTVLSALDLPCNEYFDVSSKHVRYYFFED